MIDVYMCRSLCVLREEDQGSTAAGRETTVGGKAGTDLIRWQSSYVEWGGFIIYYSAK